jgi:hypothetical protein
MGVEASSPPPVGQVAHRHWRTDALVLAIATVVIRLPAYFAEKSLVFDDGVFASSARAMRNGELPFRDIFSSQGPVFLPLLWVADLVGFRTMDAPRLLSIASGVLLTVAVYACARRLTTRGNALLAIDADRSRAEPAFAWGYSDAGFWSEDGTSRRIDDLLGPGLWEFEPGPRIVGGTVLVQAHQWTAEGEEKPSVDERAVKAWCLALDLESGLPRWKDWLAVGASGKGRLQGARGFARPAQPLAVQGGRILAGTGIGAGSTIDICDGRIVATWKFRRAPEGARTWSLCPPLVLAAPWVPSRGPGGGGEGGAAIAWASPESDRMYFFRTDAAADVAFAQEPREIGDDVVPIDADRDGVVLLSGGGGRTTLARVSPVSGARVESVELPLGERFSPCGLVSASRAIVASDRCAYLLDAGRDLYLLDTVRLPGREESPEGEVAARGERVYVAGERTLWVLRAR